MAHSLYGSAQKGRTQFALYCVAVILRRFLYQGAYGAAAVWNETEKGVRRSVTGCSYSALNVRIALISFACSLWRISSSTPK